MVKEARPSWSQMSAEQRKPYDLRAKQLHKEMQQIPGEWRRKDNQRQFIDSRADPVQEMEKRRASDRNKMTLELKGCGDLRDKIFYVINFQLLFSDDTLDIRMPVEIGIVRMSLREGILSDVHRIFYPGDVPRGYRSKALDHKNTYHQIPIEYSEADQNLRGLWQQMEEFVFKHVADGEDAPPLFCLSDELIDTEMCLQFLHDASESASRNPFTVRALDDLVFVLLSLTTPGANPAKTQIRDKLLINRWDYCSAIRCSFHENEDCKYCSLSITKRYSFAIFDLLSTTLDFELTRNHLYDDTSTDNMVVRPAVKLGRMNVEPHYTGYNGPSGAPVQNGRTARGRGSARGSGSRPVSPPGMFREPRPQGVPNRFEVCQDSSDSEDEDDPLTTTEVKSTVDQYRLIDLRQPKTSSLAASGGLAQEGANAPNVSNVPTPTVGEDARGTAAQMSQLNMGGRAPLGRGRGQLYYSELPDNSQPPSVPPGFGAAAASIPPWGPRPRAAAPPAWGPGMGAATASSTTSSTASVSARGRGVGVGRGYAQGQGGAGQ